MPDLFTNDNHDRWIAGFEGDRTVVLSQIGPWKRLSARPKNFVRKFYQRTYALKIEEWALKLSPPDLGQICVFEATLNLRFQPTYAFARQHVDHLDDLGHHIRSLFEPVIRDIADEALRDLESGSWMELGHGSLEGEIEDLVQEVLAVRDIQSQALQSLTRHNLMQTSHPPTPQGT